MVSRLLIAIALLAVAAAPARAIVAEACCACLPVERATTSGRPATQALFCGVFDDTEEAGDDCDDLGGTLLCFLDTATTSSTPRSCEEQLAAESIVCPTAVRAPVAGPGMLLGLAALLALTGGAVLHRAR
jgi:hypothetical protein